MVIVSSAPTLTSHEFTTSLVKKLAVGSVAAVLGPDFEEVDRLPTRVRLPDEPLMLVDRILRLEGAP